MQQSLVTLNEAHQIIGHKVATKNSSPLIAIVALQNKIFYCKIQVAILALRLKENKKILLSLLSKEPPKSQRNVREPRLYGLVSKTMEEITLALEKGYSWYQIGLAFSEIYEAEWKSYWSFTLIETYYKKIMKETKS